jgi:hypothetical protein
MDGSDSVVLGIFDEEVGKEEKEPAPQLEYQRPVGSHNFDMKSPVGTQDPAFKYSFEAFATLGNHADNGLSFVHDRIAIGCFEIDDDFGPVLLLFDEQGLGSLQQVENGHHFTF